MPVLFGFYCTCYPTTPGPSLFKAGSSAITPEKYKLCSISLTSLLLRSFQDDKIGKTTIILRAGVAVSRSTPSWFLKGAPSPAGGAGVV